MTDEPDTLTGSLEASAKRLNSQATVVQLVALAASTGRTGLKWACTISRQPSPECYINYCTSVFIQEYVRL